MKFLALSILMSTPIIVSMEKHPSFEELQQVVYPSKLVKVPSLNGYITEVEIPTETEEYIYKGKDIGFELVKIKEIKTRYHLTLDQKQLVVACVQIFDRPVSPW